MDQSEREKRQKKNCLETKTFSLDVGGGRWWKVGGWEGGGWAVRIEMSDRTVGSVRKVGGEEGTNRCEVGREGGREGGQTCERDGRCW